MHVIFPFVFQVLGLVGTNGIGKSTALKILAGKQKPNLGKYSSPPGLDRDPGLLQGQRAAELFHKDPGGWPQGQEQELLLSAVRKFGFFRLFSLGVIVYKSIVLTEEDQLDSDLSFYIINYGGSHASTKLKNDSCSKLKQYKA